LSGATGTEDIVVCFRTGASAWSLADAADELIGACGGPSGWTDAQFPTTKRQALYGYKGFQAYQPLNVWWAEQKVMVHTEFRDGNVPAGFEVRSGARLQGTRTEATGQRITPGWFPLLDFAPETGPGAPQAPRGSRVRVYRARLAVYGGQKCHAESMYPKG